MSTACTICLKPLHEGEAFHAACAIQLFGQPQMPFIEVSVDQVPAVIGQLAEKISGVQPKFSAELSEDGTRLVPAAGGRYLVKPPTDREGLPENEHLTMSLGRLAGLQTADSGLVSMADRKAAYVAKRFDRTDSFPLDKLDQFDFCQLLDILPTDKYNHHAEECAKVIMRYSANPTSDLRRVFQTFIFSYWVGNGDLHLKNLSLLGSDSGLRLSPAYDLLSTWVYGDQKLALYINAKQKDLKRGDWLAFGRACGISEEEVSADIASLIAHEEEAEGFVSRSKLSDSHQASYITCIRKRSRALRV